MIVSTSSVPFLKENPMAKTDDAAKPVDDPKVTTEEVPAPDALAKAGASGDPSVQYLLASGLDEDELAAKLAELGYTL